jgi:hypothetical protein
MPRPRAASQIHALGQPASASDSAPTPNPGETPAAALLRRTRTAIIRTYIELGRLEMVAGEDKGAAEAAYRSALSQCEAVYGADSRESQGPAFSLANCLRSIDKKGGWGWFGG